jgi:uncharacterized protein YbcI
MVREKDSIKQQELAITEALIKFEREFMGRGPFRTRTYVLDELVVIRLEGVLTPAELHLAKDPAGIKLLKDVRMSLIENGKEMLKKTIHDITGRKVISMHSDISALRGERIIVFTLEPNSKS